MTKSEAMMTSGQRPYDELVVGTVVENFLMTASFVYLFVFCRRLFVLIRSFFRTVRLFSVPAEHHGDVRADTEGNQAKREPATAKARFVTDEVKQQKRDTNTAREHPPYVF